MREDNEEQLYTPADVFRTFTELEHAHNIEAEEIPEHEHGFTTINFGNTVTYGNTMTWTQIDDANLYQTVKMRYPIKIKDGDDTRYADMIMHDVYIPTLKSDGLYLINESDNKADDIFITSNIKQDNKLSKLQELTKEFANGTPMERLLFQELQKLYKEAGF